MCKITIASKLKYNPYRGNLDNTGWLVANVDKEFTRYYRWWIKKRFWIDMYPPSWDAHVSIVRGERIAPEYKKYWNQYDNEIVNIEYDPSKVFQITNPSKQHFWCVEFEQPFFRQIRSELGLRSNFKFHITIGKTKRM